MGLCQTALLHSINVFKDTVLKTLNKEQGYMHFHADLKR